MTPESAAYVKEFPRYVTTMQEPRQLSSNQNCDARHAARRGGARVVGGKKRESAGKPGSVVGNHSSGMHVAVHLERPTRERARAARCHRNVSSSGPFPYLVLLRAGFAVPRLLPGARCALTAPFHPCQPRANPMLRRFAFCCTFRGLAPPRRYLAPYPMEPGLSSPATERDESRPEPRGDCLADSRAHDRRARAQAQASSGSPAPGLSSSARG
jgi:hypothetical protein